MQRIVLKEKLFGKKKETNLEDKRTNQPLHRIRCNFPRDRYLFAREPRIKATHDRDPMPYSFKQLLSLLFFSFPFSLTRETYWRD